MTIQRLDPQQPGDPAIQLFLDLLRATARGTREDESSMSDMLREANTYAFVDANDQVALLARARPERNELRVVMWLWDGRGDFRARMWPLMVACAKAVVDDYPLARSGDWWAQGSIPGAGSTPAERKADALRIATNVSTSAQAVDVDVGVLDIDRVPGHKLIRARLANVHATAMRET